MTTTLRRLFAAAALAAAAGTASALPVDDLFIFGDSISDAGNNALVIGADPGHQSQGFPIGADQDVLAVVHRHAVQVHAAGAAAERARCFEYGDRDAAGGQLHGGRHARIAGADDGDGRRQPASHVRSAIPILRSGVRMMRWSSTR